MCSKPHQQTTIGRSSPLIWCTIELTQYRQTRGYPPLPRWVQNDLTAIPYGNSKYGRSFETFVARLTYEITSRTGYPATASSVWCRSICPGFCFLRAPGAAMVAALHMTSPAPGTLPKARHHPPRLPFRQSRANSQRHVDPFSKFSARSNHTLISTRYAPKRRRSYFATGELLRFLPPNLMPQLPRPANVDGT